MPITPPIITSSFTMGRASARKYSDGKRQPSPTFVPTVAAMFLLGTLRPVLLRGGASAGGSVVSLLRVTNRASRLALGAARSVASLIPVPVRSQLRTCALAGEVAVDAGVLRRQLGRRVCIAVLLGRIDLRLPSLTALGSATTTSITNTSLIEERKPFRQTPAPQGSRSATGRGRRSWAANAAAGTEQKVNIHTQKAFCLSLTLLTGV